ncbi:hypothetical protein O1M63_41560 [Streptomyces mirabilis]|nr:hypothetical protein [Streptomyces mirabilis]
MAPDRITVTFTACAPEVSPKPIRAPVTASSTSFEPWRTGHSRARSGGGAGIAATPTQLPLASARPPARGCIIRATSRTTKTTTSAACELGSFHSTTCWTTPRKIPAAIARDRFCMAPTTAAPRAGSSRTGAVVLLLAEGAAVRIVVTAAIDPAIPQARVDIRTSEIPAMRAASGLHATARMATPYRLRVRNTVSAATSTGPMTSSPV